MLPDGMGRLFTRRRPRETGRTPHPEPNPEYAMPQPPTSPTWREKLTLTAIGATISGAVRALLAWALQD